MQDGPIPAGLDMQVAVNLEKPVRGFLQKNPRTSGRGAVRNENTVQKAITELKVSIKVYRQRN